MLCVIERCMKDEVKRQRYSKLRGYAAELNVRGSARLTQKPLGVSSPRANALNLAFDACIMVKISMGLCRRLWLGVARSSLRLVLMHRYRR